VSCYKLFGAVEEAGEDGIEEKVVTGNWKVDTYVATRFSH
jgi:hypothetical protein